MAKGIYYVESRPASADVDAEFNRWYDEVHLPEMTAIDGIVSARRFAPVGKDGPYVAIYELEGEDLEQILKGMMAAARSGALTLSDLQQTDPPPAMRLLEVTTEYPTTDGH
jgi:hypothetical protein